jgi:Fic-DOC domain mobile mystery protein B
VGQIVSELFDVSDSATPLMPEEMQALIPTYISLRSELNEAEQQGILAAEGWAFKTQHRDLLSEKFLRELHQRMFKDVWRWAGQYRTTARNIGVDAWQIPSKIKLLIDDTCFWVEHHTYSPDEMAVRFHHRLVFIHPFPNGNGRHARLMSDLFITYLKGHRFTWGRANLITASETRKLYIQALQAADQGDIMPLLKFARS